MNALQGNQESLGRSAAGGGRRPKALNNRLAPGMRGSRHSRSVRWEAFDQLPECVADAIRESRSMLCPVAALRLVKKNRGDGALVAQLLRRHAAWTDWRVLASDFGEDVATRLRPDAPQRRPKLRRRRAS